MIKNGVTCSNDFNLTVNRQTCLFVFLCMFKGQSPWIDSRPNIYDDHWKHGQKRRRRHNR